MGRPTVFASSVLHTDAIDPSCPRDLTTGADAPRLSMIDGCPRLGCTIVATVSDLVLASPTVVGFLGFAVPEVPLALDLIGATGCEPQIRSA